MNIYHSQELNVPEKDVEELLVSLILDNRIHGHIDQVNRLLERGDRLPFLIHPTLTRFSCMIPRNIMDFLVLR